MIDSINKHFHIQILSKAIFRIFSTPLFQTFSVNRLPPTHNNEAVWNVLPEREGVKERSDVRECWFNRIIFPKKTLVFFAAVHHHRSHSHPDSGSHSIVEFMFSRASMLHSYGIKHETGGLWNMGSEKVRSTAEANHWRWMGTRYWKIIRILTHELYESACEIINVIKFQHCN